MYKTVLVIGAGASKEANLPTGDELKKEFHINCYSTTTGMSDSNTDEVKRQITNLFEGFISVNTTNSKCSSFFNEFSKSLEF